MKDDPEEKMAMAEKNLTSLQKSEFPQNIGPVSSHLETMLQKHNIKRQNYHGKSFIGNDCHKYLSTTVHSDTCENIITKTRDVTTNKSIIFNAEAVANRFRKLWQLYADIHSKVLHAKHINEDDFPKMEQAINMYCAYFRQEFPEICITLKQLLLEDHALDWLMKYRFGFGLFGEQVMESIHHKIRRISNNHCGIRNPAQRLKSKIEEHHFHICPVIRACLPRKRNLSISFTQLICASGNFSLFACAKQALIDTYQ